MNAGFSYVVQEIYGREDVQVRSQCLQSVALRVLRKRKIEEVSIMGDKIVRLSRDRKIDIGLSFRSRERTSRNSEKIASHRHKPTWPASTNVKHAPAGLSDRAAPWRKIMQSNTTRGLAALKLSRTFGPGASKQIVQFVVRYAACCYLSTERRKNFIETTLFRLSRQNRSNIFVALNTGSPGPSINAPQKIFETAISMVCMISAVS